MLSVGDILKKQRLNKGLTLLDIEKKTKVREKYLRAIEENKWDFFSSKVYIIGILTNYSKILNLDVKKVLAFFRRDYEKKDDLKFKEKISQQYLSPETRQFLRSGIIVLTLFFVLYFGYQLKLYFSPPGLKILSPNSAGTFREDKVHIVGKTEKDATIMIAGQRIYQNDQGIFEYDFPVRVGKNNLIINLIGANGKKSRIEKIFIRKPTP